MAGLFEKLTGFLSSSASRSAPAVPSYFTEPSWERRRLAVMAALPQSMGRGFAAENVRRIGESACAIGPSARMHVVFNLPPDALLNYLNSGNYLNAYQTPLVNGQRRAPSGIRLAVDALIGVPSPKDMYFGALAMGGTGIRFYGEYCAVLKSPDDALSVKRVFDRNSYDLLAAPIKHFLASLDPLGQRRMVDGLGAKFRSADCADMVAIKVLQAANGHARLLTAANVGAALIDDEDFTEAYHEGPIALSTLLELRERYDETATEAGIRGRWLSLQPVTLEELRWVDRREAIRARAAALKLSIRSVNGSGRTRRWR